MVIGLFLLAFFATVSQVQYTQKRHSRPSLLRRIPAAQDEAAAAQGELTPEQEGAAMAGQAVPAKEKEEEEEESVDDFFVPHAHLPENSIYRLTMTDVTGNAVDFSQFSGMVSLVVNTACQ